jgi:hypothetical protein
MFPEHKASKTSGLDAGRRRQPFRLPREISRKLLTRHGEMPVVPFLNMLAATCLVEQWMETLNARDREIIRVSSMYIAPDTGKCFIPADELAGLSAMLGVLPETIKVKRGRLVERLKKFLNDHS